MVSESPFDPNYEEQFRYQLLPLIDEHEDSLVEILRHRRISFFLIPELLKDLARFTKVYFALSEEIRKLPRVYSPEGWLRKTINTLTTHKVVSLGRIKKAPFALAIKCPVCNEELNMRIEMIFSDFPDLPGELKTGVIYRLSGYNRKDLSEDLGMPEERAAGDLDRADQYIRKNYGPLLP